MADEELEPTETLTDEPPEETPDEAPPEETQDESAEADEAWDKLFPELAGRRGEMSPEAREDYLRGQVAVARQRESQPGDGQSAVEAPDKTDGPPPLEAPPGQDLEALTEGIRKAMEDGDAAGLAQIVSGSAQWSGKVGGLVVKSLNESSKRIEELEKALRGVTVPGKLKGEIPNVPDADDNDIAAAEQILDSGEATTPRAALALAVSNRRAAMAGVVRKPGVNATNRARALAASQERRRRGAPAESEVYFPQNAADLEQSMNQEEQRKRGK